MDSARRHHLHPSSRLLFGRSVSSLSASQVASLPPAGQLTKREVNRLHRRSRDEKTELNRRVPQSRYFSGRRKHCRVLGLNREPLSTSLLSLLYLVVVVVSVFFQQQQNDGGGLLYYSSIVVIDNNEYTTKIQQQDLERKKKKKKGGGGGALARRSAAAFFAASRLQAR